MLPECPPEKMLRSWVFGDLADAEADTVADHLGACSSCEQHVTALCAQNSLLGLTLENRVGYSDESECHALIDVLVAGPAPVPAAQLPVLPTVTQIRDYEVLELLGQGGMGVVYRARHLRLNKEVAIKLLSDQAVAHDQSVRRFEREMQVVGELDHPNVVRALDAGDLNGRHFLVMEMLRGVDLSKLVTKRKPMSVPNACELARQAAIGLQYAHDEGLVHRDIKPANLMLTQDSLGTPVVKVMDLGIALATEGASSQLTDQGQLMGTLRFMAPEQATGSQVDSRADVYSLGATLYQLLSGSTPFGEVRNAVTLLHSLVTRTPASIGTHRNDLPPDLVELIDGLLSRDPQDRAFDMREVAKRLKPFAAGHDLKSSFAEAMRRRGPDATAACQLVPPDTANGTVAQTVGASSLPTSARSWWKWLIAAGVTVAFVLGVIWLKLTDGAYLRIVADPTIDVSVTLVADEKPDQIFRVGTGKTEFWCSSGRYKISLPADAGDSFELDGSSLTVTRGARPVVTIRRVLRPEKGREKQPWDERPLYPTSPRAYSLGYDPQLEDGAGGEGSSENGWVGSDTDDVTGPSQLFTMLVGEGDLNAELFAGWKNGTGEESSLEFIRSKSTFAPLTQADEFTLTFNIEKYLQAENWGQLTIGLANDADNLFGVSLMGHSNHILKYGVSDWSIFPNTKEGITHGYAVQSDRLNANGTESVELTYDGGGNVRIRVFSDANAAGSQRYDSGLVRLAGVAESELSNFSADRIFIANDQAAGDKVRRIWLRIDDISVLSGEKNRITIPFDRPVGDRPGSNSKTNPMSKGDGPWTEPQLIRVEFTQDTRPYEACLSGDGLQLVLRQDRRITWCERADENSSWSTPAD
ncbi:MAG: protein kinase, partial [Planctomycetaceae bacterium]